LSACFLLALLFLGLLPDLARAFFLLRLSLAGRFGTCALLSVGELLIVRVFDTFTSNRLCCITNTLFVFHEQSFPFFSNPKVHGVPFLSTHSPPLSLCVMSGFSEDDWSDVEPVPQDDGPDPVVTIAYSSQFRTLMDYFRAVLKSQEYSQRALMLTQAVLQQNAANYTVWQYRRDCLQALSADLNAELDYVDSFALCAFYPL
jgi:hypothetical protein